MKKLFLDKFNEFSTTKAMNIIFFVIAVATAIIGIVAKLGWGKSLDSELYLYVGGLAGFCFGQYTYGKKLKDEEIA